MARLTTSDYRGILEVLDVAAQGDTSDPFGADLLEALRKLIPSDAVSYADYDPVRRYRRAHARIVGQWAPLTAEQARAFRRLLHGDPLAPAPHRLGVAVRISDALPRQAWQQHPLYQEVAHPGGVEHMLRLWLAIPSEILGGLDFDRQGRDFSDRDQLVLQTLAPHLIRLRLRAELAAVSPKKHVHGRLTPRERDVLDLVAAGMTNRNIAQALHIAPGTVRKHLDNVYAKLNVPNRAAAVALVPARAPSHIPIPTTGSPE
jgi:DNA-binding CsgD family transcriptional regulator